MGKSVSDLLLGPSTAPRRGREGLFVVLTALSVAAVAFGVDLAPKVEADFFFSTDDPQLAASKAVGEDFPARPQVLLSARAPSREALFEEDYLEKLARLTEALEGIDGVASVSSLTEGPSRPAAVPESPLWRRLLLAGDEPASHLVLQLEAAAGGASEGETIAAIEKALAEHEAPGFALAASGVPYVVELVRRHLLRDLRAFSLAALAVFGLAVAWLFRSLRVVVGTLTTCLLACSATLLVLRLAAVPIGLLTANIATIVFVLTLSHLVFLTAAWRRRQRDGDESGTAIRAAVDETFPASFWCMLTTLAGFTSLLFASARPLRELGHAGVVGTLAALGLAYGVYPAFLAAARSRTSSAGGGPAGSLQSLTPRRFPGAVLAMALAVALLGWGVARLDTDPSLLAYFEAGSEIRRGLETIDRAGGSSPLSLVVSLPGGGPLDEKEALDRLESLQEALEADPAVGSAISLPVLLAEGRRAPLAGFLSTRQLLAVLSSPRFDSIALSFVTEDRERAHFFLRMREAGREAPRADVVERLRGLVEGADLEPVLVGGLYDLQGKLSRLVASSLLKGLFGLVALFALVALAVARSGRIALSMLACLVALPLVILGTLGHLGLPLDVIASPAVNVALALGVDAMIHLVSARRRALARGSEGWGGWVEARREMALPVLGAMAVLAAGFGIFGLSSFPPTRNFGLAVVVGTVSAAALALVVLPYLASPRPKDPDEAPGAQARS